MEQGNEWDTSATETCCEEDAVPTMRTRCRSCASGREGRRCREVPCDASSLQCKTWHQGRLSSPESPWPRHRLHWLIAGPSPPFGARRELDARVFSPTLRSHHGADKSREYNLQGYPRRHRRQRIAAGARISPQSRQGETMCSRFRHHGTRRDRHNGSISAARVKLFPQPRAKPPIGSRTGTLSSRVQESKSATPPADARPTDGGILLRPSISRHHLQRAQAIIGSSRVDASGGRLADVTSACICPHKTSCRESAHVDVGHDRATSGRESWRRCHRGSGATSRCCCAHRRSAFPS